MFGIRKDKSTGGLSVFPPVSTAPGVNMTNADEETTIKQRVLRAAGTVDFMSAMSMNRADRRRLAKMNKVGKIPGSMKPFVKNSGIKY